MEHKLDQLVGSEELSLRLRKILSNDLFEELTQKVTLMPILRH